MAIDDVQLDIPDTTDIEYEFGRGSSLGLDLGECGIHAVIDAISVVSSSMNVNWPALLAGIGPGMLALDDGGSNSRES